MPTWSICSTALLPACAPGPPPLLAGGGEGGRRCGTTSTVNSCEFKLLRGLTQLIEPKQQMLLLVLLLLLLLQLDK